MTTSEYHGGDPAVDRLIGAMRGERTAPCADGEHKVFAEFISGNVFCGTCGADCSEGFDWGDSEDW